MSWRLRSIAAGALLLPAAELKTLIALADYASDEGVCWPSKRTLAGVTGLSETSIKRSIRKLAERGLVTDTGRRRSACAVRQIDQHAVRQLDQFSTHATPQNRAPKGATDDPFRGATHGPFEGPPATPQGAIHDPLKGPPVTPGGSFLIRPSVYGIHTMIHTTPPPARERGMAWRA